MSLTIRKAETSDLPVMTEIYHHSVETGTSSYELNPPDLTEMRRRYEANLDLGYPYFVAEEDGVVLGYAYAGSFRSRPAYRWSVEDSIYLAPDAQGKGIGYQLLVVLVDRCEELGFRQILAIIGGASPASIAVHRKAGFEDAGVMKATGHKHGQWLDTVIMQKALGESATTQPDMDAYPGNQYKG